MFREDLEHNAFRTSNGEYGWTRAQIPAVVAVLVANRLAILGGELWWVDKRIETLIPQRDGGLPGIYTWETRRRRDELWEGFVQRSASETLRTVQQWPGPDDLQSDLPGRILYNLTWTSETEF